MNGRIVNDRQRLGFCNRSMVMIPMDGIAKMIPLAAMIHDVTNYMVNHPKWCVEMSKNKSDYLTGLRV